MRAQSADLDPYQFSDAWHYITLAGKRSPGVIPIDGIKGFHRETGWDKRRAKGQLGATLIRTNFPPSEGEIEFQFWHPKQRVDWLEFIKAIGYTTASFGKEGEAQKGADAKTIFHPALVSADIDVTQVVIEYITPWQHKGLGLYTVTMKLIEWREPPKTLQVVAKTGTADVGAGEAADGQSDEARDLQWQIGLDLNEYEALSRP